MNRKKKTSRLSTEQLKLARIARGDLPRKREPRLGMRKQRGSRRAMPSGRLSGPPSALEKPPRMPRLPSSAPSRRKRRSERSGKRGRICWSPRPRRLRRQALTTRAWLELPAAATLRLQAEEFLPSSAGGADAFPRASFGRLPHAASSGGRSWVWPFSLRKRKWGSSPQRVADFAEKAPVPFMVRSIETGRSPRTPCRRPRGQPSLRISRRSCCRCIRRARIGAPPVCRRPPFRSSRSGFRWRS